MKMTEVVKEGTLDDLDLKFHGSELDQDDDYDEKATEPMAVRLLKATDYDDGDTVKTDDGKSFKVSQARAKALRSILTNTGIKASDRQKLDSMLKQSGNFEKVMKAKNMQELQKALVSMLGQVSKAEPSIY